MTTSDVHEATTAAEAAALWWVTVLRDPRMDNGSNNQSLDNLVLAAKLIRPIPDEEALERFRAALVEEVDQMIEHGWRPAMLKVDYGPDDTLYGCALCADLRVTVWPWKTVMWVEPEKVMVRYGYSAEEQVIWTAKS